jgi:DNA gyrase/topoisomerase IV subunit B
MFNSQTKESFSSSAADIKAFLKDVDWDDFAAKICRCEEIINPIVESFKIKEELQNKKTLDKISKTSTKFKCKKYLPATDENKYMAIVEGDSAQAGLSDGFGRKSIGYFATRGVPLNTYEVKVDRIADNEELTNIIKCLNIKLGAKEQNMTYENVLLASDADADGAAERRTHPTDLQADGREHSRGCYKIRW